jgi:OmpA-OmpF porin, OOP family
METYFTIKRALLVLCLLAMPTLTGCQTTAGFGRDVQSVGRWIEGGAQDTQAWMFGSPAQAAQTEGPAQAAESESPEQAITPAAGGNAVYFATGSAEIPLDGLEIIRAIAHDSKQSARSIEVTGYSDTAGPADYNEGLSQRRAEAVAAELAAQGVLRKFIVVNWHGENQLPVPTKDGVPEPENRRVSIAIKSG